MVANTPSGLPRTRPAKIPHAIGELSALSLDWFEISTPVFAKANSGTMRNELHG